MYDILSAINRLFCDGYCRRESAYGRLVFCCETDPLVTAGGLPPASGSTSSSLVSLLGFYNFPDVIVLRRPT